MSSVLEYAKTRALSGGVDVCEYAYLVKRIAQHLVARLPASVQLDDLLQAGMEGLLEAAQNFDGGKGASFETYAGIRVRGAMIDEMRRGDWVPRSVHRNARAILDAMSALEPTLGREAQPAELAEHLGVPLDDYHAMAADALTGKLFSLEDLLDPDAETGSRWQLAAATEGPESEAFTDAFQTALAGAIETLGERDQLVLSLYYQEEFNLKEIGQVLGVSESRVSQILSGAALKLRHRLQGWYD